MKEAIFRETIKVISEQIALFRSIIFAGLSILMANKITDNIWEDNVIKIHIKCRRRKFYIQMRWRS